LVVLQISFVNKLKNHRAQRVLGRSPDCIFPALGTTQGIFLGSFVKFPLAVQEKLFEPFLIQFNVKLWSPGRGQFWPQRHNLVKDLQMMLYIWYMKYISKSFGSCSFRQDFLKFQLEILLFYPVTYLCNQLKQFKQLQ